MRMSSFDFDRWAAASRLSAEVVNALKREHLTRPETLHVLARNDGDIRDLGIEVGDRIRLKAGLENLKDHDRVHDMYKRISDDYLHPGPPKKKMERRASIGERYVQAMIWRQSADVATVPSAAVDRSSAYYDKTWLAPVTVDRKQAERLLMATKRNRMFVVRQSSSGVDSYAISMLLDGKVEHFPVEKRGPRKFHIGDHDYPDLTSVVLYYSNMPIMRRGDYEVCLGEPLVCRKQ